MVGAHGHAKNGVGRVEFARQRAAVHTYQVVAFIAYNPSRMVAHKSAVDVVHTVDFDRREHQRNGARGNHARTYLAGMKLGRARIVEVGYAQIYR